MNDKTTKASVSLKQKDADAEETATMSRDVKRALESNVARKRLPLVEQDDELTRTWCYHNTKKLLQKYRNVLMCMALAMDDLEEDCMGTLGVRFSNLNDFAAQMDVDLSGTKLESRIRSMERNRLMIQYINNAIQGMRRIDKNGEEYYWILYYKYLSTEERCANDAAVVECLHNKGLPVSTSTFYRRLNAAIETLSGILWGYTARDTLELIDFFDC